MFRILIEESTQPQQEGTPTQYIKRYEQTVDELDLRLVMQAVNKVPRKPRIRKEAK